MDTKDDVVKAYSKLFSGLGKLKGEYTIRLRDDAKPFCLYTPRRVPLPLMKKVEDEINGLVKSGVIESVDEPTDWCAPMVVVPKPNGNVRLCLDLTKLNEGVRRELYVMKKVEETLGSISSGTVFDQLKHELASDEALALYDTEKETIVSADASSYGLGAVIRQRQEDGTLKVVAYAIASRSMTKTECHYAQIEKEALSTTWALEHWSDLLIGLKFHVETDHKPLVPLFSTKLIDELPVRIQRFRMRLLRFDFTISHVPGKSLMTADTLSQAPLDKGPIDSDERDERHKEDELRREAEAYVRAILIYLPASDARLDEIRSELKKDEILKVVIHHVEHGWPENRRDVYGQMVKFWNERGNLTVHEGLLLRGKQIVIPSSLRTDVLRHLHDGHQGITKTRENANSSVWWPGLSKDIEKTVKNCVVCEKYRRERVEPMKGTEFPERPWSRVGADFFFHKGSTYLLMIDYYSRDVEICQVTKKVDTGETISKMQKAFSRQGIPDILFSDNGPQFSSCEFKQFAKDYGFEHITSSPRYPQSNEEVERAVQTLKAILNKTNYEYLGLLSYRNTPLKNGYSPAQLNMGRRLKSRIPCHPDELKPRTPDADLVRKKEKEYRKQMQVNYDRRHKATKEADELSPGDRAWLPDLRVEGEVVGELPVRDRILYLHPQDW